MIFAEGMVSNGGGIQDFKRGPFDIGSPVKICNIEYKNSKFNPTLNFISLLDCYFMCFSQFKQTLIFTELEGCYYPKEFTDWQDFARETKLLMCLEFGLDDYSGTYKQKMQYEKTHCPAYYTP
jgi:hypothetical protein